MAKQKSIDGANLQLALKQNNEKMKGYIDASHYDIKKYQKYVNTELDYCYLKVTESSKQTIEQGDIIQFSSVLETNMNVNIENCSIVLKKGKKYLLSSDIHVSGTGYVRFCFYDLTNNKILDYFAKSSNAAPSGSSGKCIYIPENDCEVQIKVNDGSSSASLSPWTWPNSYFIVQEINRQITIDPVEHINATQGIEDAPVGHIISHIGTVAPKHYLVCDGTEYNISDYPYLAQHIQDNFGTVNFFGGDGTTTFAVPDLRGEFLRGTGTAARKTGSGASVGMHQNPTYLVNIHASNTPDLNFPSSSTVPQNIDMSIGTPNGSKRGYSAKGGTYADSSTSNYITARPTNTSVLYCIKYEPTYYMNVYNTNYMQPSLYSLEEKVVGCWINGKPLYEKTIEIIVPTTNESGSYVTNDTDISSLNIDLCTSLVGIVCPSDDNTTPLPLITNKNYIIKAIYVQNVIRVANSYKNYSGIKSYITIRYTKTTDQENSFTNSMLKESFIKLDSTCTDEELQQAILDIVDEINADPVVEPEQSIEDIPMTIPEIYEEDTPTVIPEIIPDEEPEQVVESEESTEPETTPEEVTPEVTDEPETEQTEVTEGGTNNESE